MRMFVPRLSMMSSTVKLHIWLVNVAHAAPDMPMSNTKMSNGSSPMFSTAPMMMPTMAYTAFP